MEKAAKFVLAAWDFLVAAAGLTILALLFIRFVWWGLGAEFEVDRQALYLTFALAVLSIALSRLAKKIGN